MNQSFLSQFRQLHHDHITLLRRKQGREPPEWLVSETETLLYKLRAIGCQTHDAGQRRRLESYAAYWGAFIYDHSPDKPYPNTALEPSQSDSFVNHTLPHESIHHKKTNPTVAYRSKPARPVPFLAPPMPVYHLVGRDELLLTLKKQLLSGDHLAISALNGLPGVGKTALAIALAHDREVRSYFRDGVLWAGLGPEADMMAWLSKWGHALGMESNEIAQFTTVQARVDRIRIIIGSRQMLLVVDDAWSVRDAMTFKLGGPSCSHIVTTRFPQIALRFAGDGAKIVRELDDSNGFILLKQLAPQVVQAEPDAAAELVHTVGGLPLALVLMGNYLRLEGYGGRQRRIRGALNKLMETQTRMMLEEGQVPAQRHPSLPATNTISIEALIEVSDDVLDEVARQAFYALSVFPPKPNTFSEEAALAVCSSPVDALDTLSDYGLLESHGEQRYTLHHIIADYARMKNQEHEAEACSRLVHFFVDYLTEHEKDHQALELETGNIIAALDAAFAIDIPYPLIQATLLFYRFLEVRGLYELAIPLLERAERSARQIKERAYLVTLLLNLGRTIEKQGNYPQAEAYFQEGLTIAQESNQQEVISKFLQNLGAVAGKQGRYDAEESYYKEGLRLARDLNKADQISSLLANLGAVAMDRGEYDLAEGYLEEGLFFARPLEEPEIITRLLTNQGVVAERRGAYEQAEAFYQESLVLARTLGYQEKITRLLLNLGDVAITSRRYDQAEQYLQEGLNLAQALKLRSLITLILAAWGKLYAKQERWQEASTAFQETLQLARELGSQQYVADALFSLAKMAFAKGDLSQARQQAEESLEIFDTLGHGEAERVRKWLIEWR